MAAVEVFSGYKVYGNKLKPNKKIVLNHLNMTVHYGSIYGLLGASGCGKTTLLSCIVGTKLLDEGQIRVLGGKPGSPQSGVPGPRVGYMPQEIALVDEFTIKECVTYFGRIYGMTEERIFERFKLLHDLLELPDKNRLIGQLSGGQKRRVSLSCALVHDPELLILDEPTVGLDPILREKIWDFLVETTRTSKLAVIITTHYIEECKQAHRIGLMRNGILLAEDSPLNIQRTFGTQSLEDAFLILSQRQGESEEADETLRKIESLKGLQPLDASDLMQSKSDVDSTPDLDGKKRGVQRNLSFSEQKPKGIMGKFQFTSKIRMKALLSKNIIQMIRAPVGIVFSFVFPIMILATFFMAIGANPKHLLLGIVNDEVTNSDDCFNSSLITTFAHNFTCDLNKISCRFVTELSDDVAEKRFYKTIAEAYSDARKGKISGYIHFASNFTESVATVRDLGRQTDIATYEHADINVHLDKTDQQIAIFLERNLRETYKNFTENLMVDCELPKILGNIPVRFLDPIYGNNNAEYRDFAAPGVIMTMLFFLATLVTSTLFITDRHEGIWDRTFVAGISKEELLLAHISTQVCIIFLQSLEIVFIAAYLFNCENKGHNFTVICLLCLVGVAGMLYGLWISIFADSHTMANFMATGSFYPMIILCGILWPLEGMPLILKYIAMALPFTVPSISARNILIRGWSIMHFDVYIGFIVIAVWIILLFTLCTFGLRVKK